MFVRNRTDREIVCRRGDAEVKSRGLSLRFANILSYDCYRAAGSSWELAPEATCPAELRRALEAPAWDGTSVTAVGRVNPPAAGMLMRQVVLRVGDVKRTLIARGPRHWIRRGEEWEPGHPAAWLPLDLAWGAAFGGSADLPAGRDEATGLPRPAFTAIHPQNPAGTGFAPSGRADGVELPRLELLEDQLTRFGELPLPGCFAPLGPRLAGMSGRPPERHPLHRDSYESFTAPIQLAPGYLVFPWLPPGTPIELTGLVRPIALAIPRATLAVKARRASGYGTGVRLRVIHIDADGECFTCVWQHAFVTERRVLPDLEVSWQDRTS